MKNRITTICITLLILFTVEIILRYYFGFCNAPLYISDANFEYIAAPNQNGERFGNTYNFNSYSQRSKEIDSIKIKILGLGDSVIYGGIQSDQDSIATSIFNEKLDNLQMLNISSGSWGPDNCAAYLNKYGIFNAKAMFLLVSSHDAFDNMDFKQVVGQHLSYPKKQYKIAWSELINRYLYPKIKKLFLKKAILDPDEKAEKGISKNGKVFNPGFNELYMLSKKQQIPLTIYLHAEQSELLQKKYNSQGQIIIDWATSHNIEIIKELDYNFTKSDYRDKIHLNSKGQKKLSEIMITKYKSMF
ncbi:hypothetical protein [uncultured Maribacter sp.]|uniref:hypothetical protein n=1 Tax=uncultured Maribacter sp. TaxID=431308 RepID=UPI00261ACABB|nr:hypothetical protein [uncultured Maribacter sp.]